MDRYRCFAELARVEREGSDYAIEARAVDGAAVAVIAPHGGGIEPHSERIARAIAADDFSFYCFRGCKQNNNGTLHITSHRFDEPQCVALVAAHTTVVAIHGCNDAGDTVYLGGLDTTLIAELAAALERKRITAALAGHDYPGTKPENICNRGQTGKGVQIELPPAFRSGSQVPALVAAVRSVLSALQKSQPKLADTNSP